MKNITQILIKLQLIITVEELIKINISSINTSIYS